MSATAHVIWDWNGTLFDDAWLCLDAMNTLLQRRNMRPLTAERYQTIFDFPVVRYYQRVGFDLRTESFEDLGTEFMAEYERRRDECSLKPDAKKTIEAVRDAGLTQSVLSAYRHDTLEQILMRFDIRRFFTHVTGSDDHYARGKAEQGSAHLAQVAAKKETVVLVGDTTHDAEVAAVLGIRCLLIPGGNQTPERLVACGVPVLRGLDEIIPRLRTGAAV